MAMLGIRQAGGAGSGFEFLILPKSMAKKAILTFERKRIQIFRPVIEDLLQIIRDLAVARSCRRRLGFAFVHWIGSNAEFMSLYRFYEVSYFSTISVFSTECGRKAG